MKMNRLFCILCLLIAGMGFISASSLQKRKTDKCEVKESAAIQLLAKTKLREKEKVVFKCRVARYGNQYVLLAEVLKNDSAVHIVKPGVRFMLADGDSIVLKPERKAGCCSEWADGKWYNASFKLNTDDVERFKSNEIVSISILSDKEEINREIATGKGNALAKILTSLDNALPIVPSNHY